MKKYLITGAAGFIGSNLIRTLRAGHDDSAIYALTEPGADLWRIHDVVDSIEVAGIDLLDTAGIAHLVERVRPTHIVHLASYGGMPFEQDDDRMYRVNFDAARALYQACKKWGFACFVNTGSSSEYGCKDEPLHESMLPEPISDYAVAKVAATTFFLKEALFYHRPVYTVRPFSVYGPYELSSRLIPSVIEAVYDQRNLSMSSPHFVRDFIFIDDMVDHILKIMECLPSQHFIFNAGTGVQSSIGDVVKMVEDVLGRHAQIVWGQVQPRPWEPASWVADTTRSRQHLGWAPRYSLRDGICATVDWLQSRKSWNDDGKKMPKLSGGIQSSSL